ncbi:MAG: DNA polymerase III subunit delta' [Parcubacteria group bacterium Gr01-1014_17]|nr:MAG: DNA polymerase III subunit delta' [Parcubacteria group bacterium Gr01-1014_17]
MQEFTNKLRAACGIARGSPDCIALSVPSFGINDAHEMRRWAANRAIDGDKKFFILGADTLTPDAQNAFLKVFEEPPPDTHFFLLVKTADFLIPTLRSRVEVVSAQKVSEVNTVKDATDFLASSVEKRLAYAEKIAKSLKDEKMTRGEAAAFVSALLSTERGNGAFPRAKARALENLLRAEQYAHDRSASFKLLLDHLALVL